MSHFSSSDVWLLQAIGLAGQTAPTSLRNILAAGDYINHAIFTWDEIQAGLQRLIAANLVGIDERGFWLGEDFSNEYARITNKHRNVPRQREALQAYLQKIPLPDRKMAVPLALTKSDFDMAVKEYLQTH